MFRYVTGLFTAVVETWCMRGGRNAVVSSNCWPEVDGVVAVVVGSGGMESAKESSERGCYQLLYSFLLGEAYHW